MIDRGARRRPSRILGRASAALLALSLAGCLNAGGEGTPPGTSDVNARQPAPPTRLLGLAAERLVDALGAPTLRRRDPPAEFWQYAGRSCVLHLFLYIPPDGAAMAVAHVEASDPAGRSMESRACALRLANEIREAARQI